MVVVVFVTIVVDVVDSPVDSPVIGSIRGGGGGSVRDDCSAPFEGCGRLALARPNIENRNHLDVQASSLASPIQPPHRPDQPTLQPDHKTRLKLKNPPPPPPKAARRFTLVRLHFFFSASRSSMSIPNSNATANLTGDGFRPQRGGAAAEGEPQGGRGCAQGGCEEGEGGELS